MALDLLPRERAVATYEGMAGRELLEAFEERLGVLRSGDEERTVRELITERIATIGENIRVRRFTRYALGEEL